MLGRLAVLAASAMLGLLAWYGDGTGSGATGTPPAPQDPAPRFKSAVDLVSVSAVVRDKKGRFVPRPLPRGLHRRRGGERRPIVGFNAEADGPVKVAVLFDISGSMRVGTKAVDAQQTARHTLQLDEEG